MKEEWEKVRTIPHAGVDIPKGRIADKNQSFASIFETLQHVLQMRGRIKVGFGILRHETMKLSGQVRVGHSLEHIRDYVLGTVGNVAVLEELDRVGNETTFGHAKDIIQRFETFAAFRRRQGPFASVFFKNAASG